MLAQLDRQQGLTGNQRRIVAAAIIGDMLEFFDYFLIGFVLAFIVTPWHLSFAESAIILVSSGLGAIAGGFVWGAAADKYGRRPIFMATVLTFAIGSGILALTPTGSWVFLTIFRFVVGFGVGGLYSVDLPLVQEFVPTRRRGTIGGLVTVFIPVGTMLGSVLAAFLAPAVGWRGLFAVGLLPALITLLIRAWVPESPQWLAQHGRREDARRSLAWALEIEPDQVQLPPGFGQREKKTPWTELFRYKRSLACSWLGNLGMQTEAYGLTLWGATLIAMLLHVPPAQAAFYYIFVTLGGLAGRISFSYLSDKIGRKPSGALAGFGSGVLTLATALLHSYFIGGVSVFWIMLIVTYFFADGGFAIVGPYASEVWPAGLHTSGMGSAYGFGGIGKILGPMGLAVVVGASNLVTPAASEAGIIPAYAFIAVFGVLAGIAYGFIGFETKGKTFDEIEQYLAKSTGGKLGAEAG